MSEYQDRLWKYITVAEAVHIISTNEKKIRQKEYLTVGDFPVIDQGQDYIGGYTNEGSKLITCERPVIVFGDHTKTVKYINKPFVPGADGVKVLQPHEYFDAKLFEYFLRYLAVKLLSKGYARHYQHLAKSCIPLPPLNEQKRIVAKIEELFSELDKGIESLKTAREQLKVYRQALLKHAFEGKLTAQWREENKDKLETADALLKRIQNEREQRYQQQLKEWQKALKKWEAGGKKDKKPAKPSQPKHLPPLTPEELADLPQLPDGWAWSRLDELALTITDGDHQAPPQTSQGVPFITISDIKDHRIDFSDTRYVSKSYFDNLSILRKPTLDDILYTVTGSFGIPCLIDFVRDFCFQRHIALIRPCKSISKRFLFYVLASHHVYAQAIAVATGTAQKTVPLGGLRLFTVSIPSHEEQQQIANVLDSRLSEVDQLEQTIEQALQQSEALRQSILKKAFSGQLVPQDPNDEPASVLLERIRAEKASKTGTASPKRPQKTSRPVRRVK